MKTFITTLALATLLTTPVFAEKTPVIHADKPAYSECSSQIFMLQATIKDLKKELALLRMAENRKPKPIHREKAG